MTDFMHGAKYDTKTRHRAAKILATGVGHRALATQLGIPEATARQWSRAYAVGGSICRDERWCKTPHLSV